MSRAAVFKNLFGVLGLPSSPQLVAHEFFTIQYGVLWSALKPTARTAWSISPPSQSVITPPWYLRHVRRTGRGHEAKSGTVGEGVRLPRTCINTYRNRAPSHHPFRHFALARPYVFVACDFRANRASWSVARWRITAATAVGVRLFGEHFAVPALDQPLHGLILIAAVATAKGEAGAQQRVPVRITRRLGRRMTQRAAHSET
jgi:hypothetical protein